MSEEPLNREDGTSPEIAQAQEELQSIGQTLSAPSDINPSSYDPDLGELSSQVLLKLNREHSEKKPPVRTICRKCPWAVWMQFPTEVKLFCSLMRMIAWESNDHQRFLIECDGRFMEPQGQKSGEE